MADNTGSIKGLAGIVLAAETICRLAAIFGPIIRPALHPVVQPFWDTLVTACQAFGASYHNNPNV